MPVYQRLTGMLAFQIRVFRVVHVNMGHVRNICLSQFSHGGFLDCARIIPDDIRFFLVLIDSLAAEFAESIDVFLYVGNTGIDLRYDFFPLNGVCCMFALQIILQRLNRIVGSLENITVRAYVIADQPDHDLISTVAVIRGSGFHEVQDIMRDIVKAVDQKLTVLNDPALANQTDSGHPLSHCILKPFFKNLLISVPDQRDIFQFCLRAAAGGRILSQESRSQLGTGKVVDLSGNLCGQRRLCHRILVILEFVPIVMQHLGDNHILSVTGDRLFVSTSRQFPDFTDQRGRREDLQVKDASVTAPVHDFRFTGQCKGFRNQNHRIGSMIYLFDQAGNQSGRSGRNNANKCHQTSLLSTG